jgi:hypothetical protein
MLGQEGSALNYPNSFCLHDACSAPSKLCNKIVFSMARKIMDLTKASSNFRFLF